MILIAISLAACAATKMDELTKDESVSFSGKTLVYTEYSGIPDFYAQTAANSQFGLFGVAKAASTGNAIIKKNGILNPALEIARELATGLAASHNLKVINDH